MVSVSYLSTFYPVLNKTQSNPKIPLTLTPGHMHEKGFIHGDLKPLNIMRVAAKMKLIDLDSACEHRTGTSHPSLFQPIGLLTTHCRTH